MDYIKKQTNKQTKNKTKKKKKTSSHESGKLVTDILGKILVF